MACGGTLGPVFYTADAVPVHSCLLMDNAQDAASFPRGHVRLAACKECGTITNPLFEKRWSAYAPEYEDQQAFSPTFNSFSGKLVQDLVERHELAGETVIDIGCSKGDFLALMCDAGVARGIGIDPSVVEGRVQPPANGRLELIDDYYADGHLDLPAKLISNRHTLEHVHDIQDMLRRMHRHAVAAGDAVTFIEVPCMSRVLQECAFEDIYYEHCSYFTPGALARALRQAGFGVSKLWLDYQDQYLLAEAVVDPAKDCRFAIEESTQDVMDMVAAFQARLDPVLETWRARLLEAERANHKIAIWGSGSKCIAFLHALGASKQITTIVDINPNRWGKYPPSLPSAISDPDALVAAKPDIVIAMNGIYRQEITNDLRKLGIGAEVMALGDAAEDH
jgi:hypothetical protein